VRHSRANALIEDNLLNLNGATSSFRIPLPINSVSIVDYIVSYLIIQRIISKDYCVMGSDATWSGTKVNLSLCLTN
jgi:hypothetical protein